VIERLTSDQKAKFRKAYRDAYAASDSYAVLDALYTKYQDLYGVSRETLVEIVTDDHRRNREHYLALHAVRALEKKERRKANHEQRKQKAKLERTATPIQKSTKNAEDAKDAAKARRRAEHERKQAAEREAERKRAIANPGYYTEATYCPVCRRNFDGGLIPPHENRRGYRCQGSGRFGVTKATLERKPREDSKADRDNDFRTVSGGLPSLGKRRR
jgi:hypothetical protein